MSDTNALRNILNAIKGPIALAFSHQAEDVAALHLVLQYKMESCAQRAGAHGAGAHGADALGAGALWALEVFTLDTGKLFPETLAYHEEVEKFFGIAIKKYHPDQNAVQKLEEELGEWGMRESLDKRHHCCHIRKVEVLRQALAGKSAWITGLRAAQSITRANLQIFEYDENNGLLKINPLADWSDTDLSAYIKTHNLPVNPLYGKGFKSIGCAPCTRAVKENEDIRAGRWWWENPEHKECGLHLKENA
jgi:phosphoadenosine phosphosulfate reductase